ncbi:hypothetical protein [Streptomyces sp. NPDC091294]|uniref:hypothetical protein n=1 Tax=Streptomyces sp. NPDC091294 TaxID=3365992 RepID=UPI00380608C6
MTDKNERMKPPARRTGRTLGGGTKKATPPPPPPAAELTPEQYAAEQVAAQDEGGPAAGKAQVQPAPSTVPVEASAQGPTKAVPEVAQAPAQSSVEAASSTPVHETASSQPTPPAWQDPAGELVERQVPPPADPTTEPAAVTVSPTQPAEHAAHSGPASASSAATGAAPLAEVAIRPAAAPIADSTAFPVRSDTSGGHQEQDARSQTAPSKGTPWAQGPGRPLDIPETAVVLNQRIITRESLDSSVPTALKLKKRLKRFALDNDLDHLPIGDIVAVLLDEGLTTRGF